MQEKRNRLDELGGDAFLVSRGSIRLVGWAHHLTAAKKENTCGLSNDWESLFLTF
jgi:hypothetical protein